MWDNVKLYRFPILFQLAVICGMISGARMFFYIPLLIALIYVLLIRGRYFKSMNVAERTFSFYLFLSMLFGMFTNIFWQPIVVFHFVMSLITWASAYLMTRSLKEYYFASRYTLLIYQIVFIVLGLFVGFSQFPVVVPFEGMIPGTSANGITSFAILLQINYLIISFVFKRESTIPSAFFTLVIALMGYGRGSILSAVMILIVAVFIDLLLKNKFRALGICFLIFIVISWFVGSYYDEISYFLTAKTKLSAGLVDESRASILNMYLSKMEFPAVLIGADYEGTVVETRYNGNPHNSFIRAHHIFGLFYLLFLVLVPLLLVLNLKKNWERFVVWLLLGILYFRAFSEPIIWPTVFDFFYFSICFILCKIRYKTYMSTDGV